MARGGHHGGGFHGGGHHFGGGGFHGGGFGGGSFHGGGYHGGSFDGDSEDFVARFAVFGIIALFYFGYLVADGQIPGLNLVNLCMFALSAFFFFLAMRAHKRQGDIEHLHQSSIFAKLQVWKADYKDLAPANSVSDKVSWAAKYNKNYRIAFFDKEYGEENIRKVNDLIKRTPKIIWMSSIVWLIIGFFSTASNSVFYEWLIPYFETREMTDEAFAFVDELIFYLPAGFTLLCAISCYVFVVIRDNLLHECAMRIVEDNNAARERMLTKQYIVSTLSNKWYYNICPNCGAEAKDDMSYCNHCGTTLEVLDFNKADVSAVHRISEEAENAGKKPDVIGHTD